MPPHKVRRLEQRRERGSETRVHATPHLVLPGLHVSVAGKPVHDRPQRAVAEALVVRVDFIRREVDRRVFRPRLEAAYGCSRGVPGRAAPAEPQSTAALKHRLQRRHQPTNALPSRRGRRRDAVRRRQSGGQPTRGLVIWPPSHRQAVSAPRAGAPAAGGTPTPRPGRRGVCRRRVPLPGPHDDADAAAAHRTQRILVGDVVADPESGGARSRRTRPSRAARAAPVPCSQSMFGGIRSRACHASSAASGSGPTSRRRCRYSASRSASRTSGRGPPRRTVCGQSHARDSCRRHQQLRSIASRWGRNGTASACGSRCRPRRTTSKPWLPAYRMLGVDALAAHRGRRGR